MFKQILLILLLNVSFLNALSLSPPDLCLKYSEEDLQNLNKIKMNKCFFVSDLISVTSITTKIAGKDFYLKILKNPLCFNIKDVNIYYYNNNKSEIISEISPLKYDSFQTQYKFNIDKVYKNVSLLFVYQKNFYQVLEFSNDNFAIKPYKYIIENKRILEGKKILFTISAISYDNKVISNYSNNDIKIDLSPQTGLNYDINFKEGISKTNFIFSSSNSNILLTLLNSSFSNVDEDDTNIDCRQIKGEKDLIIYQRNKGWLGISTNEIENNPYNNTINIDIKNNNIRDLRFKKINW